MEGLPSGTEVTLAEEASRRNGPARTHAVLSIGPGDSERPGQTPGTIYAESSERFLADLLSLLEIRFSVEWTRSAVRSA